MYPGSNRLSTLCKMKWLVKVNECKAAPQMVSRVKKKLSMAYPNVLVTDMITRNV